MSLEQISQFPASITLLCLRISHASCSHNQCEQFTTKIRTRAPRANDLDTLASQQDEEASEDLNGRANFDFRFLLRKYSIPAHDFEKVDIGRKF